MYKVIAVSQVKIEISYKRKQDTLPEISKKNQDLIHAALSLSLESEFLCVEAPQKKLKVNEGNANIINPKNNPEGFDLIYSKGFNQCFGLVGFNLDSGTIYLSHSRGCQLFFNDESVKETFLNEEGLKVVIPVFGRDSYNRDIAQDSLKCAVRDYESSVIIMPNVIFHSSPNARPHFGIQVFWKHPCFFRLNAQGDRNTGYYLFKE